MYSVKGLEHGIEQCRKNITVFEKAIEKERATIKEYYRMIEVIEEKKRLAKEISDHIEIEIERDGDS